MGMSFFSGFSSTKRPRSSSIHVVGRADDHERTWSNSGGVDRDDE